jgi:NADPH:quinone reductase
VKAAVYYVPGGPEVLRYEDVPDPELTDDGVLVRVETISIEGGDTLHRAQGEARSWQVLPAAGQAAGGAPRASGAPQIAGYSCAGTVLAVGGKVSRFRAGDRVAAGGPDGSHAELRVAPGDSCWAIPPGLPSGQAACVPVAFGTAGDALFEFGRLQRGETVLVHAGAGGVGIAAVQLARRAGARVLATASRDDKLGRLTELGLDHGINHREADFAGEVRRLTGSRGADVIIDPAGGENLHKSLNCLAYRGRCVTIGEAGRQHDTPVVVSSLRAGNQSLIGYFLGAELYRGDRMYKIIARRLDDVAEARLRVIIDRVFPLSQAAEAHAYIESRAAFGRVLLKP